jgi:hypothetical protein
VNTIFGPTLSYEVHLKNIIMVVLEEVLEDAHKVFEEHQRVT